MLCDLINFSETERGRLSWNTNNAAAVSQRQREGDYPGIQIMLLQFLRDRERETILEYKIMLLQFLRDRERETVLEYK